jgi:hypothetical protein
MVTSGASSPLPYIATGTCTVTEAEDQIIANRTPVRTGDDLLHAAQVDLHVRDSGDLAELFFLPDGGITKRAEQVAVFVASLP